MPRLPNAELAVIDAWKITRYLLAINHPVGGPKAYFFRQAGYRLASWTELRDTLHGHASSADLVSVRKMEFGMKYTLEGPIMTPSGRTPRIRTVWIIDPGETAPRLVTAYPLAAR
ncbi:MAG TPA: hypothetical protein VHW66_11870 [Stellaceae bacterium]|jgi:hypothetical protein|nr:hypothetical protein [Stellaceae bacterium]